MSELTIIYQVQFKAYKDNKEVLHDTCITFLSHDIKANVHLDKLRERVKTYLKNEVNKDVDTIGIIDYKVVQVM